MANPTTVFGFSFPLEGADPWYTGFDTFASQIDTAISSLQTRVFSIQNTRTPRHSIVISSDISSAASYVGTTAATGGAWLVMSQFPYGRYVGSFSIIGSGAVARFDITQAGQADAGGTAAFGRTLRFRERLIINPGSLTVPSSAGDMWQFQFDYSDARAQTHFTAMTSLGVGNFSVEAQVQVKGLASASFYNMSSQDRFMLTMTEGYRVT